MSRPSRIIHMTVQGANTSYRIESDKNTFAITYHAKTKTRSGKDGEAWYPLAASYYGSIEGALRRLLREELLPTEATSIGEVLEAISAAEARVLAAIQALPRVPVRGES